MKVRPTLPLVVVFFGLLASAPRPRTARAQQSGASQAATPAGDLHSAPDRKVSDYVRKWMGKYEAAVREWGRGGAGSRTGSRDK